MRQRADQAKEDKRPHADSHKYGYTEKPLSCALTFPLLHLYILFNH